MSTRTHEYNAKQHASSTFSEIWCLMHTAIERYRFQFCEALGDVPARRARELNDEYPARMPASMEEFNAEWSLRFTRTIGRFGIELFGRYYYCPELEQVKNEQGEGKRKTFVVHVIPEDIRTISLRLNDGALLKVPCTEWSETALPLEVHLQNRRMRKRRGSADEQLIVAHADARIDAHAEKARARLEERRATQLREESKIRKAKTVAAAFQSDGGAHSGALDKVLAELQVRDAVQGAASAPANTERKNRVGGSGE